MRILAIDPGVDTGVCLFDSQPPTDLELSIIIPGGLSGFQEWVEFGDVPDYDVMVVESFELEEGTHGIDLTPKEIIGYLKSLGTPIVWQRRMERGKDKLITPAVLKRAGLYPKRGELKGGHQVAALQHALAFLIRKRDPNVIQLLHPREEAA